LCSGSQWKTITKEPKKVNFLRKNNLQIHHEFRTFRKIRSTPKAITFAETMAVIEDHYTFEPTALKTAYNIMLPEKTQDLVNYFLCGTSGTNSRRNFSLLCAYYFEDVIGNPNGTDHQK
jgi:hypothetical protein